MAFGVLINLIVAAALFRAWRTARHSNARGRFKGVFWANVTMGIVTLVLGIALQGRFSAYLPPYFYVLGWIAWLTMVRRTVVRYALVPSKSQRHSLWFDQYPAALILTDASGRVVDMNTAAQAMVGAPHALSEVFPPDSARADWERFLGALKSGAKVSQWEQPIIDAQRQSRLVAVDGEVLDTGSSRYWAFGLHDARRGHHDQELAQQLLYTDPLTGISSAFGFRQQLDHVTKLQPMEPAAVIFMDLDNFKTVNDTFGHRVGDRVLVDVAKRLAPLFRPGDVVARLGGDEFVALLRNTRDLRVEELLARIMRELERPLDIPEVMPLAMSVSIGLARYPLDSLEPEILLHQADQAMYEAKRAGKNQFRIYRSEAFQEM